MKLIAIVLAIAAAIAAALLLWHLITGTDSEPVYDTSISPHARRHEAKRLALVNLSVIPTGGTVSSTSRYGHFHAHDIAQLREDGLL